MLLSYNDLVHTCGKIGNESTLSFNPLIQFADVNCFSHKSIYFLMFNFFIYPVLNRQLFFRSQKYGNKLTIPTNFY